MPHASLETLSDDELHSAVRRLTARSNVTLADLLAHLGEVETRGIHRNRACATLYTYCLYDLRMSEDAAYRRSRAARLVHQHPDLHGILSRGEIHLTGLLMIAPYLGGERHAEILERARFRSKHEIARLIAEIDPRPEVPPRIEPIAPAAAGPATFRAFAESLAGPFRSLPIGDRPEDWIDRDREPDGNAKDAQGGAASGAQEGAQGSAHDGAWQDDLAEPEIAEAERALEGAWQARESQANRPLRYKVQFTASQEYVDLLEEALDLLGYKRRTASLPEVQLRALRELVERLRKRRTGTKSATREVPTAAGAAPARDPGTAVAAARDPEPSLGAAPAREAEASVGTAPAREPEPSAVAAPAREAEASLGTAPESPARDSRYIPVAVRRAVWARDASRCAYRDERGRRCSETGGLDVHHRHAHAWGGPPTVQNLELRCKAHNILAAEQDFGRAYMDRMRGVVNGG